MTVSHFVDRFGFFKLYVALRQMCACISRERQMWFGSGFDEMRALVEGAQRTLKERER